MSKQTIAGIILMAPATLTVLYAIGANVYSTCILHPLEIALIAIGIAFITGIALISAGSK